MRVKVYMSVDIEGVAGVVDWAQCREGAPGYELGCRLLLGEVNAAIDGAVAEGAQEIVVNDAHGTMRNLDPEALAGSATYVSGRHKPLYMMQDLDQSFDLIFLVGYHGAIGGEPSTLSHSYNPEVFASVRLGGAEVGESGINALVADHYQVPIGLVSGDQVTQAQAAPFAPTAIQVVTKHSRTRFAAHNLHPSRSRQLIHEGAKRAVALSRAGRLAPPGIARPARLELDVQTADMAEVGCWVKGAERTGTRTITIEDDDPLAVFRSFVAVSYITRQAGGR